jgi:DNA-binding response OmpR family regulator
MSGRIVLVEDEELISTMVRINLVKAGYEVQCFGDAESMLDHARAEPACCDLMLLDIMLPGMHGDAALQELRSLGFKAPVMMLTARRDIETRVSTLEGGADDYLAKPFNVDELLARVRALTRRWQATSDNKGE